METLMEEPAEPSLSKELVFQFKSSLLKVRRGLQNALATLPYHLPAEQKEYPFEIAISSTPLWVDTTLSERALQLGKAHNLRVAVRRIQHIAIPGGSVFSFWRQVGRATRRRGFVEGRQISEGCLVPAIGGGLCQLSNALYDVALQIGAEIGRASCRERV